MKSSRAMLSAVSVLALTPVTGTALGAPEQTSTFHFTGQSGSAVLTDCGGDPVPGDRCRAVSVLAVEERVSGDPSGGGPGMMVTLFDVTIVAAPPFFVAVPVGNGVTTDAVVQIPGGLSHGIAAATDVALESCEFPDGEAGPECTPAGSVSVEVRWDGFGPTSSFRFHDMFSDPFGFLNGRFTSRSRSADASGTLDGQPVEDTALFPARLNSTQEGMVSRFAPLANSPAMAAAAATAASVRHTSEASAFAALSNCPASPAVGTVCEGVLVNAFVLGGRVGHQPVDDATVSASFFELTFTPDGLRLRSAGSGVDTAATVTVDAGLAGATADANVELTECGEFGCTPVGMAALSLDWVGHGDIQPFRFHSQFGFDGEHENIVGRGETREATATATIDGTAFTHFPGFTAVIQQVAINSTAKQT